MTEGRHTKIEIVLKAREPNDPIDLFELIQTEAERAGKLSSISLEDDHEIDLVADEQLETEVRVEVERKLDENEQQLTSDASVGSTTDSSPTLTEVGTKLSSAVHTLFSFLIGKCQNGWRIIVDLRDSVGDAAFGDDDGDSSGSTDAGD